MIVQVCCTVDDLRWSLIYQMSEDIRVRGLLLGRLGRCKYGRHLDVNIVTSLTLKARRIGFEETDEFDNSLSLVKSVEIHELIRVVDGNLHNDDELSDFLVNDLPDPSDLPDTLYLSDGTVLPVGLGFGGSFEVLQI